MEDEYLVTLELETILTMHGWRVLEPTTTVDEALELLDRQRPDVAFLNVHVHSKLVTPVAEA